MFGIVCQFTQPLFAIGAAAGVLSAGGALILLAGLWLPFGLGARRRRAFGRAQRLLQMGVWQDALALVKEQQGTGRLSPAWEGRLRNLEGECRRAAGENALRDQRFEEGLENLLSAARLLGQEEQQSKSRVVEVMLAEVRRLFAAATQTDVGAALALTSRLLVLQNPCAEASLWQGLCHIRQDRLDLALASLRTAEETETNGFSDPPFYLGAVLLRQGLAHEAVRFLSEANRIAPASPFPTWQLGSAILEAEGDGQVAVRALQRARDKLAALQKNEARLWFDGLPEGKSYVRRLASKHSFTCPLLGGSLPGMLREAQIALGQAHYRLGNFQEAVQLYTTVLHENPPTVPVLRGLGQALARLERYEEAYNHLRAAYDQEEPKNAFSAGYLALCGARGKPAGPEDKVKNVNWALSLLAQFDLRGNGEWAWLCSAIHAEARLLGLVISVEDQIRLCEALASVDATDPLAAAAYEHLAATNPDRVRSEYAWLYCRTAEQHGCGGEHDLDLFARVFQDGAAARAFYADRRWDFEDMEFTYLQRFALRNPGRFPDALGAKYAVPGAGMLLARSRRLEQAGKEAAALACVEVLRGLAPQNVAAHDRLAQLYFRQGNLNKAADLLTAWHALAPADPLPLVRRAVIDQKRGNREGCTAAIELALERTRQQDRADVAFLGARLLLADLLKAPVVVSEPAASEGIADKHSVLSTQYSVLSTQHSVLTTHQSPEWQHAILWLTECLKEDANHIDALWCLAAVHAILGDRIGLAKQSAQLHRPEIANGRFQYLAGCSHLAAGDNARALEACALAEKLETSLAPEAAYLAGLASLQAGNEAGAVKELEKVITGQPSLSLDPARALLGRIHLTHERIEDAIKFLQMIDASKRAAWRMEEPLRATVFLSALLALKAGKFSPAANRLREAGRLGYRDRRLGGLLILALVRDGQRLLREVESIGNGKVSDGPAEALQAAARAFEQAMNAGCRQAEVAYLLALAHKRQGKLLEAHTVLRKLAQPDANALMQMGILSLGMGHTVQAEQELSASWERDGQCYAIGHNLLRTRLAMAQIESSAALLPKMCELASDAEERKLLELLHALLNCSLSSDPQAMARLAEIDESEEEMLLVLLRSIGHLETIVTLLTTLATVPSVRASGTRAQDARFEAILLKGKSLLERCHWGATERLLSASIKEKSTPENKAAFLNLLGCCACLCQDFKKGIEHFRAAARIREDDPFIQQNLALVHEWQGKHAESEPFWEGYFKKLKVHLISPPGQPDYGERLSFEGYTRLANTHADKERWPSALAFAQRALNKRPNDPDTLEKLFHLYTQSGRPEEARRTLRQLREARPSDAQIDLYELDLMNVRNLDSLEEMVNNIERVLKRNPSETRVEVRATLMVGNILPVLERLFKQIADQLAKVTNQVRYLPKYQIDWSVVREVSRDLRRELHRLRRLANRCFAMVKDEEQRHTLEELNARIERKLEQCRSLGG